MYLVQVGKGKGQYTTRYSLETFNQACLWYKGLNVHSGYKKRITFNGKVLIRYIS